MKTLYTIRLILSALLLSTFFASLSPISAPAAQADTNSLCTLNWELVPGPSFPGEKIHLMGLDSSATDDVWAVGFLGDYGKQLLTLHWNGDAWQRVAVPDLNSTAQYLYTITAENATNAWAAGAYDGGGLVLVWDGLEWTQASIPPSYATALNDIDSVSNTEVWAVGRKSSTPALIRWNGTSWLDVSGDIASLGFVKPDDIVTHSATDIFVSGILFEDEDRYAGVAHWDGNDWTLTATIEANEIHNQGYDLYVEPISLIPFSTNDIWLGLQTSSNRTAPHYRILHWTGTSWESIQQYSWLEDLQGLATNSIYSLVSQTAPMESLTHWEDGTRTTLALPQPKGPLYFRALHLVSAEDVWIVGDSYDYPNQAQPYLAHGIAPCTIPGRPAPKNPANGVTVEKLAPLLNWNSMPNAIYYTVRLKQLGSPTSPRIQETTFASKYRPEDPLTSGATYKWRVRACSNGGCGPWSKKRTFTIQ